MPASDGSAAVARNNHAGHVKATHPCWSLFQSHDAQIARGRFTRAEMRLYILGLLLSLISAVWAMTPQLQDQVSAFYGNGTATGRHTNNWAVLVCSSRYWFNYRVGLPQILYEFVVLNT